MTGSYPDTLALSRRVLRVLIVLNLLMGVLIMALLVATFVAEDWVMQALRAGPPEGNATLHLGMRLIALLGIAAVPVVHSILTRLLTIVDTVRDGDPFITANAVRLKLIAWAVLVLEVMHLAVGLVAASVSSVERPLDIDRGFSLTRWLVVLLLFVLARVFEQGARMRDDLEGTV